MSQVSIIGIIFDQAARDSQKDPEKCVEFIHGRLLLHKRLQPKGALDSLWQHATRFSQLSQAWSKGPRRK
jgi:hypothetical protein